MQNKFINIEETKKTKKKNNFQIIYLRHPKSKEEYKAQSMQTFHIKN